VSTPTAEAPVLPEDRLESPVPPASTAWDRHALVPVLAPAAAVLFAMFVHYLLPNRQSRLPTHVYPVFLQSLLAAALLLALVPRGWRRLRPWARHYGPLLAGAAAWLGLWDLITLKLALVPLPYFPGPEMVLRALIDDRQVLFVSTYHSLVLLLSGYLLGAILGIITGVLIGYFRPVRYWGMPVLKMVGPIPATAFIPLAMALFTNSFFSGTALIALAVWFPVTMLTISGVANVPVSYLNVARTLGAGRGYLIFRVAIPSALPSIFVGLFMGLGVSFLTLMAAETVGVKSGLGYYVNWQRTYAEFAKVYAALVIMAFFFSGIMTLLFKLRDQVLGWQKGVIQW
jgi:NitT/TauT family transport system permease protein